MRDPHYQPLSDRGQAAELRPPGDDEADKDITRDKKAFTAAIRTRVYVFIRILVIEDFEQAIATLSSADIPPEGAIDAPPGEQTWTAAALLKRMDEYYK